jgi:hypothetical protein
MRRRHYLAIGATLLAGCSSGDGGDSSNNQDDTTEASTEMPTEAPTETSSPTPQETETEEPTAESATVPIGEVVEDNTLQMVVRDVSRAQQLGEFTEASEGSVFVVIRLAVKNTTEDSDTNISGFTQTRIKDGQNYTYDPSIVGSDLQFQGGIISPGEVARGDLYFEIPEDAEDLMMQFDFSGFSLFDYNRVTVDLSESADNIADISQNLQVDINSEGYTAEFEGLQVTLNSVEYETSLGEYTEASEGFEYAIIDISTTNGTDEELSVSTLLQMEAKDELGFSYSPSITAMSQLDREYPQGSPLGPGEERRGKVVYEVPTEADELYWMFEFGIFVDGYKVFWQLR